MCAKGSAQEVWLQQDLAAHPTNCTLAYFHVPRFTSGLGHHNDANSDHTLTYLWDDLYAGGVDVILNGHDHDYERFAPMNPAGQSDPQRGIREFVVGTGGDNDENRFGAVVSNSEVRNNDSFGVLQMTLHNSSYDWKFVNDGSPVRPTTTAGPRRVISVRLMMLRSRSTTASRSQTEGGTEVRGGRRAVLRP